jgi:Glyoxalase/Bleomycin resistance protein/Dioxygenase superfamily
VEEALDPSIPTTGDETLFQIGFVTRDIRASMREFTQRLGVGPWHLRERGVFPVQFHRGEPTGLALAVAMGYAPSSALQYELIQQLDDLPSIYQDVLKRRAHGFHHYGVLTRNYEASVARYKSEGFEAAYEAEVPGGRVSFFDTTEQLSGMVEIVQRTDALAGMFEGYRASSIGWDGADPVRLRPPLPQPT